MASRSDKSRQPTADVTVQEFEDVFNINVKSIYLSIQEIIPILLSRNSGGSIINIASTGSSRPRPGLVWYNATKGAVKNATKGLAAEYGPRQIRVNSISPLLTSTALFEQFVGVKDTPENRKQFVAQVPMGRIGEVDDVARVCVFLASDDSKFITGENIKVDGGKCI
jgi:NAD(P)-dependent dehydrogenase (short-subunit alcohol dehydrogenase family)